MPIQADQNAELVSFNVPVQMKRSELRALLEDRIGPDDFYGSGEPRSTYRSLLDVAKGQLAFERSRKSFPGLGNILGDPVWLILLDLFVRETEGKNTSVSSSTIASGAPATTALRYVATLTSMGIIMRNPHPYDHRSVLLSLSIGSRAAICDVLRQAR